MSINGQGQSLTLVKGHSDFEVKCLTFGLYTQVSDSGPLGPLVFMLWARHCQGSYPVRGQVLVSAVMSQKDADGMANSVDPEQSDLIQHCLLRPTCPNI